MTEPISIEGVNYHEISKRTLQQIVVNDKTCFHNVYDKTFTMRKNVKNGRLEIQFLLQETTCYLAIRLGLAVHRKNFFCARLLCSKI